MSQHLVIDIDGPEGELTAQRLGLLSEPTLEVNSGRVDGGRHRWYHHPGGIIGNISIGRGIDVRADAGYVILPPSLHRSGKRYTWAGKMDEVAEFPRALLPALRGQSAEVDGVIVSERKSAASIVLAPIRDGERNMSLARYAGRMFRMEASVEEVLAVIRGVNQANCSPPLDDDEVVTLVQSIGRRDAKQRLTSTGTTLTRMDEGTAPPAEEPLTAVAALQTAEARAVLDTDRSNAPRWCWPSLNELVGPMLPGELHVVGALMGNGKSSFLMTQMDAFARKRVGVLYIPLEIDPKLCLIRWAAWKCLLDPVKVLRGEWHDLVPNARELMDAELEELQHQHWVHFVPEKRITMAAMRRWCERAKGDAGVEVVMIDHLHRLSIGDHAAELRVHLTETVRSIADMLRELDLVGIAAAQLNRSSDLLDAYYPPGTDRLKESSAIAEEPWTVHMLSRQLRSDVTVADIRAAKQGQVSVASLADPGVMVVTNRKDRMSGAALGHAVRLQVQGGIVMEPAPRWRELWVGK